MYMHAYMYIGMYIYMYMYVYMYLCMCICIYVCMCMYVYMYVCMHVYVCIYVYVCMYACICMYVCMYVYILVHGHKGISCKCGHGLGFKSFGVFCVSNKVIIDHKTCIKVYLVGLKSLKSYFSILPKVVTKKCKIEKCQKL
jgi:hypothetical protein